MEAKVNKINIDITLRNGEKFTLHSENYLDCEEMITISKEKQTLREYRGVKDEDEINEIIQLLLENEWIVEDCIDIAGYVSERDGLIQCETLVNPNFPLAIPAIYGFKSMCDAEAAAKKLHGTIAYIVKREGWEKWHAITEEKIEPFQHTCEEFGYHCESCNMEEFETTARDEIVYATQHAHSLDEIDNLMKSIMKIREKITALADGEVVFYLKDGDFGQCEVVRKECLVSTEKNITMAIAVVLV